MLRLLHNLKLAVGVFTGAFALFLVVGCFIGMNYAALSVAQHGDFTGVAVVGAIDVIWIGGFLWAFLEWLEERLRNG